MKVRLSDRQYTNLLGPDAVTIRIPANHIGDSEGIELPLTNKQLNKMERVKQKGKGMDLKISKAQKKQWMKDHALQSRLQGGRVSPRDVLWAVGEIANHARRQQTGGDALSLGLKALAPAIDDAKNVLTGKPATPFWKTRPKNTFDEDGSVGRDLVAYYMDPWSFNGGMTIREPEKAGFMIGLGMEGGFLPGINKKIMKMRAESIAKSLPLWRELFSVSPADRSPKERTDRMMKIKNYFKSNPVKINGKVDKALTKAVEQEFEFQRIRHDMKTLDEYNKEKTKVPGFWEDFKHGFVGAFTQPVSTVVGGVKELVGGEQEGGFMGISRLVGREIGKSLKGKGAECRCKYQQGIEKGKAFRRDLAGEGIKEINEELFDQILQQVSGDCEMKGNGLAIIE